MGYDKEIYSTAIRSLESRRLKSINECKSRQDEFYRMCPRGKDIKMSLSSTAIQIAKAVLSGSDAKRQITTLKEKNLELQKELQALLRSHHLPEDHLDIRYHCSKCNDTGYIDGKMCSCLKNILKSEAYNRLNSLSPLSLCSFESFSLSYYSDLKISDNKPSPRKRMADIFRYCKNYADSFSNSSPNLLMQGATGLGKTHISLAIATEVINKGFGVIYGSTQNIVSKLEKERFNGTNIENYNSEHYLIECDLLILDDLGTEFSTSFSTAIIYNITNSRIMSGKPTIISTNLSLKELEKSYSERFVSRIMGNTIRLEYLGSDIRLQKRLKNKV